MKDQACPTDAKTLQVAEVKDQAPPMKLSTAHRKDLLVRRSTKVMKGIRPLNSSAHNANTYIHDVYTYYVPY